MSMDSGPSGESLPDFVEEEIEDLVEGKELSKSGRGPISDLVDDLEPEDRKEAKECIGEISHCIGTYLDGDTNKEDIEDIAVRLYKDLAASEQDDFSYTINYILNRFEVDIEVYGLSREELEKDVKGGIRSGFQEQEDAKDY